MVETKPEQANLPRLLVVFDAKLGWTDGMVLESRAHSAINKCIPKSAERSMSNQVLDYGWSNSAPVFTQDYLLGPIVSSLRNVGAQRVLDLGCGNGAFSHGLQQQGFEVLGCDADERGIAFAKDGNSGARFKQVSVYDDPISLEEFPFDAVVSTEVIEHLFQPSALPRFAHSVLKAGGLLILSTPYHGYWKNLFLSIAGKWDSHHGPLQDGGHIKFWSYRTLSTLLTRTGYSGMRFIGVGRCFSLWKSMIVTAHKISTESSALQAGSQGHVHC